MIFGGEYVRLLSIALFVFFLSGCSGLVKSGNIGYIGELNDVEFTHEGKEHYGWKDLWGNRSLKKTENTLYINGNKNKFNIKKFYPQTITPYHITHDDFKLYFSNKYHQLIDGNHSYLEIVTNDEKVKSKKNYDSFVDRSKYM